MRLVVVMFTALLAHVLAAQAGAAELQWKIVTSMAARDVEYAVQRLAEDGYRVQAIVAGAPSPTVALARVPKGLRRNVAVAEYRVIDPRDAALVQTLGADGFRLRSLGKAQLGRPLAVFERDLGAPATPRAYLAVQAPPGGDLLPLLAQPASDGYRVIGAVGDSGSEWVLLERDAASPGAGPREARVVSGPNVSAVEAAINALAAEGFACDAVWDRPPKGFGLFRAGTLTAAVSRRRGVTTTAPKVAINFGRLPDGQGTFLAVVPYRGRFAFVVSRGDETDYATREVAWTDEPAKAAWEEAPFLALLGREWWKPIVTAWAISSANKVTHWVALERR